MGVEDLKHFKLGAAKLSKATLDTIVDYVLRYAREPHGLRVPSRTLLVKTQAGIAAQASGSCKYVVWDGSAWYEEGEAFTAFNIGPGDAPTGTVLPLLSGHTDLPTFQYFAGAGTGLVATLGGGTTFLSSSNTAVYDPGSAVLITTEIVTAGQYLLAGAMVIEPGGAGVITLRISINGAEKVAAVRNAPATYLDSLGLPMFAVVLAAGDDITLVGDAYGGTPGDGALKDSTYLTVIGPLDGITVS